MLDRDELTNDKVRFMAVIIPEHMKIFVSFVFTDVVCRDAASSGTLDLIRTESGLKNKEILRDQKKQLEQYRTKQRQRNVPQPGTPEIPNRKIAPNAPPVVESIYDNVDAADFSSLPPESMNEVDGAVTQPAYQNVQGKKEFYWWSRIQETSIYFSYDKRQIHMGLVVNVWLSCYLVLLSFDNKTR